MKLYVDGSSTPNKQGANNKASYAIVFTEDGGKEIKSWTKDIGNKTNNEAEYEGVAAAYDYISTLTTWSGFIARILRYQRVCDLSSVFEPKMVEYTVYTDSKLVYGQVMKGWKCQEKFRDYISSIKLFLPLALLEWIPREKNLAGRMFE